VFLCVFFLLKKLFLAPTLACASCHIIPGPLPVDDFSALRVVGRLTCYRRLIQTHRWMKSILSWCLLYKHDWYWVSMAASRSWGSSLRGTGVRARERVGGLGTDREEQELTMVQGVDSLRRGQRSPPLGSSFGWLHLSGCPLRCPRGARSAEKASPL
jgi:hypothetical protein